MELPAVLGRYKGQIEAELREIVQSRPLPLYRMMSYQLGWIEETGDPSRREAQPRIRPTLCLIACEATGGQVEEALPAAAAVELVHNFALIHDDIQGGNPERDHRSSVWWLWGAAQAINAGDGMHALARLAMFRLRDRGAQDYTVFRAIQMLDEACLKLCEGQFLDLSYQEHVDAGVRAYLNMVEARAGALMECALKLGVLLGSGDEATMKALGLYGKNLGIALQVREDITALWAGSSKEKGSPASDILNKKKSLPVAYAFEKADVKAKRQLGEIYFKRVLEPPDVEQVARVLEGLGAREYCQGIVQRLQGEALEALDGSRLPFEATKDLREVTQLL